MRPACLLPLIAVMACSSDSTAPAESPAAGTYSEYTVDNQQIPYSTPVDTCERVNTGGWLTLAADGSYSLVLDRMSRICAGQASGSDYLAQMGTYQMLNDTVITFQPTPPYGPPFLASFDPGTYQPGQGGRVPGLRFSFVGHMYWALEEVVPLGAHR